MGGMRWGGVELTPVFEKRKKTVCPFRTFVENSRSPETR